MQENLDFTDIAKSYITWIGPSPEQKHKSELRLKICKDCEYRTEHNVCDICKCLLVPKSYSSKDNPCPLNKWDV